MKLSRRNGWLALMTASLTALPVVAVEPSERLTHVQSIHRRDHLL